MAKVYFSSKSTYFSMRYQKQRQKIPSNLKKKSVCPWSTSLSRSKPECNGVHSGLRTITPICWIVSCRQTGQQIDRHQWKQTSWQREKRINLDGKTSCIFVRLALEFVQLLTDPKNNPYPSHLDSFHGLVSVFTGSRSTGLTSDTAWLN